MITNFQSPNMQMEIIRNNKIFFFNFHQLGCERRSEVFCEIQKRICEGDRSGWGSGWGVRVDVKEEVKFVFVKIQKKKQSGGEVGLGVRLDVNEEVKWEWVMLSRVRVVSGGSDKEMNFL